MLLQPVVENAVNHGIFNKEGVGTIKITFSYLSVNELAVEILDDGVGYENTKKKNTQKISSSIILTDRLFFLNQSDKWEILYTTTEAFPNSINKVTKATFSIKKVI
jgi:LytS/YehU family sensor histidine kinase